MKIIYCLPAHPSYFTEDNYTKEEVDGAISQFKDMPKPRTLGKIPVEFIFFQEPGKIPQPIFHCNDTNSPDDVTGQQWIKDTLDLAESDLNSHVKTMKDILKGLRKTSQN